MTNDTKGQTMTIFFISHKNGCGSEQITADTPEEAIEIYRESLSAREGDYPMFAVAADDSDSED